MGVAGKTEGIPTVPDPDEDGLGRAMKALTGPQRRFAMAAVMFPFAKDWQIAKAAGYSDRSHGSLRVAAHRNFHDEKVLAAIRECADKEVRSTAMLGVATIKKIARRDDHKDQFKAASWLAAMNEFAVAQNINIRQTVTDTSGEALMDKIKSLAEKHGLDAGRLLGIDAPSVVEGEFSEVESGND
jgi:phage terminase small subunit